MLRVCVVVLFLLFFLMFSGGQEHNPFQVKGQARAALRRKPVQTLVCRCGSRWRSLLSSSVLKGGVGAVGGWFWVQQR